MRRIFPLVVLVATLAAGSAMTAAAAEQGRASVSMIHGLPGFTADVYLDDELLLDGFRPTQATEPIKVDAGTYDVDIREAGRARRFRTGPVRHPAALAERAHLGGRAPRHQRGADPDVVPQRLQRRRRRQRAVDRPGRGRCAADRRHRRRFEDRGRRSPGEDVQEVLKASGHRLRSRAAGSAWPPRATFACRKAPRPWSTSSVRLMTARSS